MPEVGGRTPTTTSTRTSAGGMCIIGGADEASQIQSLTERVTALERRLALLLGGDVEAGQLSDISQQVGWVHGITYLGTPGWTRTAAGTLIPPPGWSFFPKDGSGWTLSDGSVYHGVSMDENGVIQFGFQSDGTVSGAKVDEWDAGAGAPDYAYFSLAPDVTETRDITIFSNSFAINVDGDYDGSITFKPSQAGLYAISCNAVYAGDAPASGTVIVTHTDVIAGPGGVYGSQKFEIQRIHTIFGESVEPDTAASGFSGHFDIVRVTAANQSVTIGTEAVAYPAANMPANFHISNVSVKIVRLGSLT
jgi:hypothetical protein